MIRILVMTNDSLLADSIVSVLSEEIDLHAARVTRRPLGKGQPYSAVIVLDEGESNTEAIKAAERIRDEITLLVIQVSLESQNIHVYESYQLNKPHLERVVNLVRDFGRVYLSKKNEEVTNFTH